MRNVTIILFSFIAGCILAVSAYCEDDFTNISMLKNLSIEELMDIEVELASRKGVKYSDVPAAVYVITGEDIRRSGALNIAEALRMVPGLHVGKTDTDSWVISSRGFSDTYSNKLLVQVDGRSIYTPLYSGVEWSKQNFMLEDIDRIEVIRGPGASLWGANAVNGIINIVTKNAKDSQGWLISGGNGTYEKNYSSYRYGGNINGDIYYRFYAEHNERRGYQEDDEWKGWRSYRGGFRIDKDLHGEGSLTVLGGLFLDEDVPLIKYSGQHILGRLTKKFSSDEDIKLQLYYNRISEVDYSEEPAFRVMIQTFDADFQHRFKPHERHELIWGAGVRVINDRLSPHTAFLFDPQSKTVNLFSAFFQDDITLVNNKLNLIIGSKFEHNDYTGFEIQPNIRMRWTPDDKNVLWASVSRAVRTPSRAERTINAFTDMGIPGVDVKILGNSGFNSEVLNAYEIGYRFLPSKNLTFDAAAFYNVYDRLLTFELGSPYLNTSNGRLIIPNYAANKMDGKTYGIELAAYWQPYKWWTLKGSYSYLQMQLHLASDSTDTMLKSLEDKTPHNQFSLRSFINISRNVELDSSLRYSGRLPAFGYDSYLVFDARIGWRPAKNFDLSLYCQNLFNKKHMEFGPSFFRPLDGVALARELLLKLTWRF
jgi:iron complex outermembrane receptor protein